MKNKFDFYEVVKINTVENNLKKANGKDGVVMGMAQDENGEWNYAVRIYFGSFADLEDSDGWSIDEQYLQPTGKFMKREDFYDGSTAKVVVDEKGHGHLKELNLKDDKSDKNV